MDHAKGCAECSRALQNIAPSLPTLFVPGEAAGSRVVTTRSTSPDAFPAASPASEAVRDGEIDGERSLPRLRRPTSSW